jgi:hypothetical protein
VDQGIAAVWAGVAGLVGAGIGGAGAVWGAAIGGRRTVEAAERQAQRAAAAEHQHWLRQQRYEAYQALTLLVEEAMSGPTPTAADVLETTSRVRAAVSAVAVLGPNEVSNAAVAMLDPFSDRLVSLRTQGAAGGGRLPNATPAPWDPATLDQLRASYAVYRLAARSFFNEPPA